MIAAFALGGKILNNSDYTNAAINASKFIEDNCPNLRLRGLMFMPTLTKSANEKNESMERIKRAIEVISSDFDNFDTFSFGTSHDYPIALKYGSNLIRVGENIFGKRE